MTFLRIAYLICISISGIITLLSIWTSSHNIDLEFEVISTFILLNFGISAIILLGGIVKMKERLGLAFRWLSMINLISFTYYLYELDLKDSSSLSLGFISFSGLILSLTEIILERPRRVMLRSGD